MWIAIFIQQSVFIARIRVVFSNNMYVILQELIPLVGHKFQLPELNFLLIFSWIRLFASNFYCHLIHLYENCVCLAAYYEY
jgi:hypothetical protein